MKDLPPAFVTPAFKTYQEPATSLRKTRAQQQVWLVLLISLLSLQLTFADIPKGNPQPNPAGVVTLRGWDAKLGAGITWEASAKYLLFSGSSAGSQAEWTIKGLENISYDVNLLLRNVPASSAGKSVQLQIGPETLQFTLAQASGDLTSIKLGTATPGEGEHTAFLKGLDDYNDSLMEVYRIVLTPVNIQRWWNPLGQTWETKRPPLMLGAQWHTGNGNFDTPSPMKDVDDARLNRKGYAIVTTEKLRKNLTKLNDFIAHKEALGFTVYVVTEKDHGGGHGAYAADNIRTWLRNNYQSKDILYVLMVGDPDIYQGDVPMAIAKGGISRFERQAEVDAGEVTDWYEYTYGVAATDHYYVDLVNETIDADGDGVLYSNGDWGKGHSGQWSVLVGRIQVAGEGSQFGKYSDVDAILQKFIDYENEADTTWRYRPDINDTTWNINAALYEFAGVEYRVRGGVVGDGHVPTDFQQWQNDHFLTNYDIGYIRTGGHGSPTWTQGGLSVDLSRNHGNNVRPYLSEIGSCEACEVGYDNNLCASQLRYGSIGVIGGSRPVSSLGKNNGVGEPFYRHSRFDIFTKGEPMGLAHWHRMCDGHRSLTGSDIVWTLNGDPSIKVIPQAMKPTYPIIARPTQEVVYDWDGNGKLPHQEYDITNNTGVSQTLSIQTDSPWLSLDRTSASLAAGETITVTATANTAAVNLDEGQSAAHIYIKETGGYTTTRKFNFFKRTPHVDGLIDFDNVVSGQSQTLGSGGATVAVNEAAVVFGGVSGKAYDTSIDTHGLVIGNDVMPSARHHSMALSFWFNSANAITANVNLLHGSYGKESLNIDIVNHGTGIKMHWPSSQLAGAIEWNEIDAKYTNEGDVDIATGTWHQVTMVHEYGGINKLFFDGQLVDSAPNVGYTYNFNSLTFGKGFNGLIDEIQSFNYALNDAQVAANYQRTKPVPIAPAYNGIVAAGDVQFDWTDVHDAAGYELFISSNKTDVDNPDSGLAAAWTGSPTEVVQTVHDTDQVFWRVDAIMADASRIRGDTSSFRKVASGYVAHTNQAPVVTQSTIDLGTIEGSKPFGPFDLSQYYSDPEGGELLVFHKNTATGTYGPWGGAFSAGLNIHGSGQVYSNEGVTNADAQTINLKVVDDRGQETFFDLNYKVEQAPKFTGNAFLVMEDTAVNTVVTTLTATDANRGDTTVIYSAVGGDGLSHFAVAPDGTVTLIAALDFDLKPSYSLVVSATDEHGYSSEQTFTISIGNTVGLPLLTSHSTSFAVATLTDSGLSPDIPDRSLASITIDAVNDRLDITTTGNTDTWKARNNGPIAYFTAPGSESWAVETEVELNSAQNRQIAGLTVYADEDGAKPVFSYGLDYWNGRDGLINLQGLGTNNPLINVSANASGKVKLRMEVIENGHGSGVDRYTFFYDLLDGNGMQKLTSYGFAVDRSRIGLFLKTEHGRTAYFDNFEVSEVTMPAP
ncbi:LamG-like jellyroll fold domain-containing protein [Endozoicomonas acroporae]|uniref:LamG-like jellyroll fold domain-containing protein n=1 Tax=Endozoicomonas acroporae TaxID=1701104 RepID=UPI003D78C214